MDRLESLLTALRPLPRKQHLEFGGVAVRERFFAQACFIAQQAGEKALKAIAYAVGERVVLGHSLVELIDRLEDRVNEIGALKELGGILDQYYVPTRYPNGLPGGVPFEAFGESQAKAAIEAAGRFIQLARTYVEGGQGSGAPSV